MLTYHPNNISGIYSSTAVKADEISTVKFYAFPTVTSSNTIPLTIPLQVYLVSDLGLLTR
jgi:hypothetical protein